MKNLIEKIENNGLLTKHEKDLLIDSISLGSSVSVAIRMVQTELKMGILEILHKAENKMTISEIQEVFAEIHGYEYTVQRFSAMARQLGNMDLIEKDYLITGNSLIINGKRYPEKIAKFYLKTS